MKTLMPKVEFVLSPISVVDGRSTGETISVGEGKTENN